MLLEVFTPQGPELHRDVSTTQRPVLLLDMSTRTRQGRELHLDVFRLLVACAAAGLVYTAEACAASRHVYTLGPELHLDVSYPQGPVPTYCRTCSLRFENNLLTVGRVRFALKIIFLLSNVFALLRK